MADKSTGEKPSKKPAEKPTDKPAALKPPVTLAPQRKQSLSKGGEGRSRGSFDRSPQLSSAKASPATPTAVEGPAPPPITLPPPISEETEEKKQIKAEEDGDNKSSKEEDEGDDEGDSMSQLENENLELKHPLQYTWTLWFDLPLKDKSTLFSREKKWSYTEALSFSTVEDFWRFYNNLLEPEKLKTGSTYCLFKKGIMPGWEDPANSQGGRWMVELPRNGTECEHLNNAFLMVILSMIGENFDPKSNSDDIVGVTTSVRKDKCRIEMWTRTASDLSLQSGIGAQFKRFLEIPNCPKIQFQPHSQQSGASSAKFSLTI